MEDMLEREREFQLESQGSTQLEPLLITITLLPLVFLPLPQSWDDKHANETSILHWLNFPFDPCRSKILKSSTKSAIFIESSENSGLNAVYVYLILFEFSL